MGGRDQIAGQMAAVQTTGACPTEAADSLHPHFAFAGFAALPLASTLVVAGTDASLRGQICSAWKAEYVGPDLGQHDFGRPLANASHGVQADDLVLNRAEPLGDLLAELIDEFLESVRMHRLVCQQEALVWTNLASQCSLELWQLGAELTLGEISEHCSVGGASHQCFKHVAAGPAQHIAGYVAELDPRRPLERLLNAATFGGSRIRVVR
jgi:hypothetical protein